MSKDLTVLSNHAQQIQVDVSEDIVMVTVAVAAAIVTVAALVVAGILVVCCRVCRPKPVFSVGGCVGETSTVTKSHVGTPSDFVVDVDQLPSNDGFCQNSPAPAVCGIEVTQ